MSLYPNPHPTVCNILLLLRDRPKDVRVVVPHIRTNLRAIHPRLCLTSVGEVTVKLDRVPGAGGRNQQFAMACALELENHPGERLTVFSAGSDGIDGNTQSAGAIADPTTVTRAHAFGFHLKASLAAFNACPMFTALGDAVVTGPTGHNLRDLRLLLADNP